MPDVSKRGIYYRLEQSPYTVVYGPLTFYFSSPVYRNKFAENIKAEVDIYNYRKTVRSGIRSTAIYSPAFEYYKHIENRGFYCVLNWLGQTYEIKSCEDLRIADIPEVIFHAAD